MKILVGIANYGIGNDSYLARLIQEYRAMGHDVHIVVFTNVQKNIAPDIEVVVGLPNKNPWSLPFAHKKVFAERLELYDLFIYSEDDTLITQRNIEAFLRVTTCLPKNHIAGFIRSETDGEGKRYFSTVHSWYHWELGSIRSIDDYTFAHFTNEHSACYILTQDQLRDAINSGGYLVPPHEGNYDLLVTAATDPYTQCGFKKLVCISHLEDFIVIHLPNKYIRKYGLESDEFYKQIDRLLRIEKHEYQPTKLLDVETKLPSQKWSKSYYEESRFDMLSLLPEQPTCVLSIGCGWGATEATLVKQGVRVVGAPLDAVIAACAEAKGVEIVCGDFKAVRDHLDHERFDAIILSNILHLVREPVEVLSAYLDLLAVNGRVVIGVPNFAYLPVRWKRVSRLAPFQSFGHDHAAGLHLTTHRMIRAWLTSRQLMVDRIVHIVPPRWQMLNRLSHGMASAALASDLIAVGRKV